MTGENVNIAEFPGSTFPGTVTATGICNTPSSSTFSFSVDGPATGPYPGTFTATGTFTTSGAPDQHLLSLSEQFTIDSVDGTVTGSKQLDTADANTPVPGVGESSDTGECGSIPPGSGEGADFIATYSATIQSPSGSFTDRGRSVADVSDAENTVLSNGDLLPHRGSFDENFGSDLSATEPVLPTSADQCKHGGWMDFGVFKNQGDCVSFVATGGKNPPSGA